jgi:Autophagocytosis associated protein, active-site domain
MVMVWSADIFREAAIQIANIEETEWEYLSSSSNNDDGDDDDCTNCTSLLSSQRQQQLVYRRNPVTVVHHHPQQLERLHGSPWKDPDAENDFFVEEEGEDDDNEDLYRDIWQDEDTVQLPAPSCGGASSSTTWASLWSFSVVYSDIWKAPVLYFTADAADDGRPLSRSEILAVLLSPAPSSLPSSSCHGDDRHHQPPTDQKGSWDFVSCEEHPVSGQPSYFLHPCNYSQHLDDLLRVGGGDWHASERQAGGATPPPPPQMQQQSHDKKNNNPPAAAAAESAHHHLWSWLAMVLPQQVVRIAPATFVAVQRKLLATSTAS